MLQLNKIYCEDCLIGMQKIDDKCIDMIWSDLPYGVTSRNEWDCIIPFNELWTEYERIIKDNGAIVLTSIQPFTSLTICSKLNLFKYEWIWRKQQGTGFLNAKKQPLRNHESILVFYKSQPTYNPQFTEGKPYKCKSGRSSLNYREQVSVITENEGKRYPLTVLDFSYDKEKFHPTQKPIRLGEYFVKTYTNENDLVLDNCTGSGSFCLAAKNLNRNFIGFENNLDYYKIACNRIGQSV